METKTKFDTGEVVRLKSGGPEMTVDGTTETRYVCIWFDGGKCHRQSFSEAALEQVDE